MKTIIVFAIAGAAFLSVAQPPQPAATDMPISSADRRAVIDGVAKTIEDQYVFVALGAQVAAHLRKTQADGVYGAITSSRELGATLTKELTTLSHDIHLRVYFHAGPGPAAIRNDPQKARERAERRNFGFIKVDQLSGNVGFIDLRNFFDPGFASEALASAMRLVSHTDALIIDLRQDTGGSAPMVAHFVSYFFSGQPIKLSEMYTRDGSHFPNITPANVPGPRYLDKPVYILISKMSFSAAEAFAYNMQALKRATIVGEVSGGGANPGGFVRVNEHFDVFIPANHVVNAITGTNWEGTGVHPEIETLAPQALQTAHLRALADQLGKVSDPDAKTELEAAIQQVKAAGN